MKEINDSSFRKILLTLALYLTSLFAANTLGFKVMPFIFGSHLSVAVFSFPFVFLTTDVIGEVYGKRMAKYFVWAGILSTALFILYSFVSIAMPWSKDGLWAKEGYNMMFGISIRMSVASLLAFGIAEYQDVLSFFFFRERCGVKYFWLRSTLSNIWSQLIDTVIFTLVAFAGAYSTPTLVSMIVTWWIYKVIMGLLYTPLSYLGIYLLREKKDASQAN